MLFLPFALHGTTSWLSSKSGKAMIVWVSRDKAQIKADPKHKTMTSTKGMGSPLVLHYHLSPVPSSSQPFCLIPVGSIHAHLPCSPAPHVVQPATLPFPSVTLWYSGPQMLTTCLFRACAASHWHARRVYKTLQIPTKTKSHSQAGWYNAALWELAMSLGKEL